MLRAKSMSRRIFAPAAAACLVMASAALPIGASAATGVATFAATGGSQTFIVPAGVTGLVAHVFGARGGAGFISPYSGPISSRPGADGGHAAATLTVTPAQALEVVVGGHGIDRGAGGFNGGGDGSSDVGSGCCPGGGGGGATDIRVGACATGLTCGPADRVLVVGGGGGAGGGFDASTNGGAGGGTTGAKGDDSVNGATGGGGGTQAAPGAGGLGAAVGSPGDPILGTGGQGGSGGGGGGGGWHGAGGGAADANLDGAGGGGGSGGFTATANPVHLVQGGNAAADGSATFYWMTWSPAAPVVGQPVTLTSHMPAETVGGTETFTQGATTLCANVLVAADGTANCTVVLPLGSNDVTATMAALPAAAHCDGLTETSTVVVLPASTTTGVVANPTSLTVGQSVTLTATVKPVTPGAGAPTGTVTFESAITLCNAVPLTAGVNMSTATCTTSALPVGSDSVLAAYSGSPSFLASSGPTTVAVLAATVVGLPTAGAGPQAAGDPGAPAWVVLLLSALIATAIAIETLTGDGDREKDGDNLLTATRSPRPKAA